MAYTISHYNGTIITTVADGTIDASLDIKLIGKNYAGYGQIQNENFVYLLENFAGSVSPPGPVQGQIWFDSGNNKLKFWDGSKFRTTGGAEIGPTAPTGLTTGDFWFDTATNQLFAWSLTGGASNTPGFVLVGPQAVAGSGTTEMLSTSVKDSGGGTHTIIQALVGHSDGTSSTMFTISTDTAFTLDPSINPITGFTQIQKGITLAYTNNNSTPGVTTDTTLKFWGTASNADRLGGLSASSYVQATGSPQFSSPVNFSDAGYTVGNPTHVLRVYNNSGIPTIQNQISSTIAFQTLSGSAQAYPLQLVGSDVLPGVTTTSNLGNSSFKWANVYATTFNGTATQANSLSVGGVYQTASSSTSPNTIVARDNSGNVSAGTFNGAATTSYYADLAEKYLTDNKYEPGTVVSVGGTAEVTAAVAGDTPIGVVSTQPGYMMNSELKGGTYIALKGRVPVKVVGPVTKGDRMIPTETGNARSSCDSIDLGVFAISLETSNHRGVKLVECVIL